MKHVSAGYVDSTTETHDDPSQPREVGVLRRTLLRAQEIIRGLAQGNGELRKELQALWARNQALELQLKEKSNILPFRSGTFDRNLLKDYREVVRQRDDLMQQRDKLCRDGAHPRTTGSNCGAVRRHAHGAVFGAGESSRLDEGRPDASRLLEAIPSHG
jgi:hypothetical protein